MASLVRTTLFVCSVVALSLIVFPLFAHSALGAAFGTVAPPASSGLRNVSLVTAVQRVIQGVLGLLAIIAVAAIVVGGFRYITAFGDEDGAAKGKKTVLYAVIGLVIIGLSVILVNFVMSIV